MRYLLIVCIPLSAIILLFSGCAEKMEPAEIRINDADLFIASEEFQLNTNKSSLLRSELREIVSSLPETTKLSYDLLTEELFTTEDVSDRKKIAGEIQRLLNFDYYDRMEQLNQELFEVASHYSFTIRELKIAAEKLSPALIRTKSVSEIEEYYEICLKDCNYAYNLQKLYCNEVYKYDAVAWSLCLTAAERTVRLCDEGCKISRDEALAELENKP